MPQFEIMQLTQVAQTFHDVPTRELHKAVAVRTGMTGRYTSFTPSRYAAEVALPSDREVRVMRAFNALSQLLWDAHTKPELVKKCRITSYTRLDDMLNARA